MPSVLPIGTLIPLPPETRAYMGFSHIIRLSYLDIIQLTSGTAQQVLPAAGLALTPGTIPAGAIISKVFANVVTAFAFSGANNGTLTGSLGDSGSATQYVNALNLKAAGYLTTLGATKAYTAADALIFTPTAATQAITALVAGQIDFYLKLDDASNLMTILEPAADSLNEPTNQT